MTLSVFTELKRRRAWLAAALVCAAAAMTLPASASAAAITCGGSFSPAAADSGEDMDLDYTFGCSDSIAGFSIVSTARELDIFDGVARALDRTTGDQKTAFECEGEVPGNGVSCSDPKNAVVKGAWLVKGAFGFDGTGCSATRLMLTVAGVKGNTYGPFTLKPRGACRTAKRSRRTTRR